MDDISRLKILKEIAEEVSENYLENDSLKKLDQLTSLIFQNSGPV